jgi:hypothetical protein
MTPRRELTYFDMGVLLLLLLLFFGVLGWFGCLPILPDGGS